MANFGGRPRRCRNDLSLEEVVCWGEGAHKSVWVSEYAQVRQLDHLPLQLFHLGVEEFIMETDLREPEGVGCEGGGQQVITLSTADLTPWILIFSFGVVCVDFVPRKIEFPTLEKVTLPKLLFLAILSGNKTKLYFSHLYCRGALRC